MQKQSCPALECIYRVVPITISNDIIALFDMVVVPLANSLLPKARILFFSLSVTVLPSLPSKLALKGTSSNSILTSKSFSTAQIFLSLARAHSSSSPAFKLVFQTYSTPCLTRPRAPARVCVCVCVCARALLRACFAMLWLKMFARLIFVCFVWLFIYLWASALCTFYSNPAPLNGSMQFHYCTLVTREPEQTTLLFWSAACGVTPHGLHTADRR